MFTKCMLLQIVHAIAKVYSATYSFNLLFTQFLPCTIIHQTRMHSSRMRTVRSVSRLPGGRGGAYRGCVLPGGVCLVRGGVPALVPPRGQTDTCKNITFATSLRTVKMVVFNYTYYQAVVCTYTNTWRHWNLHIFPRFSQ